MHCNERWLLTSLLESEAPAAHYSQKTEPKVKNQNLEPAMQGRQVLVIGRFNHVYNRLYNVSYNRLLDFGKCPKRCKSQYALERVNVCFAGDVGVAPLQYPTE